MKDNFSKKILSAFLAFVMVFLMIPFSAVTISAEADYAVPTTGHKLLYTYNALSGKDISSNDAPIMPSLNTVFNEDKLEQLIRDGGGYTLWSSQYGEEHKGNSLSSFAADVGFSISRSVGFNIGLDKILKASATKKFGVDTNVEYSTTKESYFYEYAVKYQTGFYTFNENKLEAVRDYSNGYLDQNFINALTGEDGSSPEEFFKEYGTHIITGYSAGGTAGVYMSSVQKDEDISVDFEAAYGNGANAEGTDQSSGITLGMSSALDLKLKIDVNSKTENFDSTSGIYAYGGTQGVAFTDSGEGRTSFNYTNWISSINETNSVILADDRLKFVPIWTLLPTVGYEDRFLELTAYFLEQMEFQDNDFIETFGIDESMFDYSQDWLNFENCTIITDEEGLNNIRNDLYGVYVLANNITLEEYADWEPIGTTEEPFRGRLYGNYNTISGFNMISGIESNGKTYMGLFGCNDGLVSDIKVSGNISTPSAVNSQFYIGSVAAYNMGIVNNCYDDVKYDVSYDSVTDLNIPIEKQAIASNMSYKIGNELGIYLVGSENTEYTNVNIVVEDSGCVGPVYIILENVNIMGSSTDGTICNKTTRPVYLISVGQNIVKGALGTSGDPGANGSPAICAQKSDVHIFGDDITIFGGYGGVGDNGRNGSNGEHGSPGKNGGNGNVAVLANSVSINTNIFNIYGGNGGNGGHGGYGNNAFGKTKKNGGDGGDGGDGAYAIFADTITIYSGIGSIYGGSGGKAGDGGAQGKEWGTDGKKGYGGDGGDGSRATNVSAIFLYDSLDVSIANGIGGTGGGGRSTGSTGASPTDVYTYLDIITGDKNAISGIVVGFNSNNGGKVLNSNNFKWVDNILQIDTVLKTEYFDVDKINENDIYAFVDGNKISYGRKFNTKCKGATLVRMGTIEVTYTDEYDIIHTRYVPIHITKNIPDEVKIIDAGKTEFAQGEAFDPSGVVVAVKYLNGDVKEIKYGNTNLSISTPSTALPDRTETVTVTYEESGLNFSAKYNINVVQDKAQSIFINTDECIFRFSYIQGETIDFDKIAVYATYLGKDPQRVEDGLRFDISPSLCNVGTSTLTIRYGELSTTYPITVVADEEFDHSWNNGVVTLEATHITTGIKTYTCTIKNCGATKTEIIPKLEGHTFEEWYELDDTYHQSTCECGHTTEKAHTWKLESVVTPATHLTEGEMLYTCTVCDATEIRIVEKTSEHTFGEWEKYNDEQHYRFCACEEKEYENHIWDDGEETTPATYDQEGIITYTCTMCDAFYTVVIPPLENAPQIVIDEKRAAVGETIEVKIGVINNPGVAMMRLKVSYDSSILTLENVVYNREIGGASPDPVFYDGYAFLLWYNENSNVEDDFIFATLTFTVNDTAVPDSVSNILVTYDAEEVCDIEENNVTFYVDDGSILVLDHVMGDINGDNALTSKDLLRLARYFAGWQVEINDLALDVNGDGVVNSKDLLRLARYLAGWDVEIY